MLILVRTNNNSIQPLHIFSAVAHLHIFTPPWVAEMDPFTHRAPHSPVESNRSWAPWNLSNNNAIMDQTDRGLASQTTVRGRDQFNMRDVYQFDPLQHYYSQDSMEPRSGRHSEQNLTLSQKSYDFQRNQEDRQINAAHAATSSTHLENQRDSDRPKRKRAVKRKYQDNDETENEENEEQRNEREKFYKERRMRRSRFRHHKKYDLSTEEDVGGSVRTYAQTMLRHTSRSHEKMEISGSIKDDDDKFNISQELIPIPEQDSGAAHPVESLIRRAETYLSVVQYEPTNVLTESNDPMRFLKMGHSAPKGHELPFKIHEPISMDDTPKRVHVECNDAYRRHILGLGEWPQVKKNAIILPRFKGDTGGMTLPLKEKNKNPRGSKREFKNQNMLFEYELLSEPSYSQGSNILVKSFSLSLMRQAAIQAGFFPPDRLPRSCFNPMIKRARFPSAIDTFHYFPLSSRYISEESFRLNTARYHANDFMLSIDPTTAEFFRPVIRKSCTILDRQTDFIHYRYASQVTARIICGTAGSVVPSSRHPGGALSRLLRFLNRDTGKWCRSHWIMRASQEMASNQALWSVVEPIISHLAKSLSPKDGQRLITDLEAIKSHLLTGEGLFANPFYVTTSDTIADMSLKLRRELWGYVRFAVTRLRKLLLEPQSSEKSLENDQHLSGEPHIFNVDEAINTFLSSPIGQTSHGLKHPSLEMMQPPYQVSFSLLFTQKQSSLGAKQSTEFNELFSQITHQGKMDIAVVQLTMASLLTELSLWRFKLRNASEQSYSLNRNEMLATHQQILSYLDTTCLLLANFCKTIRKNIISSPLAITVLLRQSYIGNIGIVSSIQRKRHRSSDDDDDFSLDSYHHDSEFQRRTSKEPKVADVRQVAANLVSLGETVKDFQLSIFSDIHLTSGIAELCRILSPAAADILSRSWAPDDIIFRTPFDLVRLSLTNMDSLGHILRDDIFSTSMDDTSVNKMIVTFEKVGDLFQQCLSYNASDVVILSWHLAVRAGSLVLASGLVLSETTKKNGADNPIGRYESTQELRRRRPRHENYSFIRASTVLAFKDLVNGRPKAQYVDSLHHLMISSFLEWADVVHLLSSRPRGFYDPYEDLRKLHASHTLFWATANPSKENLMRVLELCLRGVVHYDAVLSMYASMIERKPFDISTWTDFAFFLGPSRQEYSTNKSGAKASGWWGDGRLWWEQFFQRDYLRLGNSPELLKPLSQFISKTIKQSRRITTAFSPLKKKTGGINNNSATSFLGDVSWMLPDEPTSDDDDIDDFSEDSANDHVLSRGDDERDFLPRCHAEIVSDENVIRLLRAPDESSLSHLDGGCRILCAKILVCAHLFGRKHSFVSATIRFLLLMSGDKAVRENPANSNAIDALRWLIDHGFLIQSCIVNENIHIEGEASRRNISSFKEHSFLKI